MKTRSGRVPVIAIDGPAGSGKSTIAAHLARQLGFVNFESGAMYRVLALAALERGVSLEDEAALLRLAGELRIELLPSEDGNRVLLDARDVSARIREADVAAAASRVSVHPRVREYMVAQQRELGLAAEKGVIMEGRDIGTRVFPDADLKIFLEAHPEVRANRRLRQRGAQDTATVAAELAERDLRDRQRAVSPLVAAEDAVVLDTSEMSIEEVIEAVGRMVEERVR